MLLDFEGLWVDTFRGLRDGNPQVRSETIAGASVYVRRRPPGPEQLYVSAAGEKPRVIRQSKFDTTPDENRQWRNQVEAEENQFENNKIIPHKIIVRAIPSERVLWEALKKAETPAQVRRICTRSKIWLKPRIEFPDGSFLEYWPFRRILYRDAEKFCRAKLDARYPRRDQRKSGDYRRVEYLSRVMAGLTIRIAPSTAVEVLRKLTHLEECQCWRCSMGIGIRFKTSLSGFLALGNWFR